MSLRVLHPGLHTTVQDHGRFGFRAWGVPVGGAFDVHSHDLANALVGNDPTAATFEMTLQGGTYEADTTLALALAGAPMNARVERDGRATAFLRIPQSLTLQPGDRLVLRGTPVGARTYLAVAGGWKRPVILGSRSSETPLKAGDLVSAGPGAIPSRWLDLPFPGASEQTVQTLRAIAGPDATAYGLDPPAPWADWRFQVGGQSDRMGLRLEGVERPVDPVPDRVSAPVAPGAVQMVGGHLIILGVACGTMGGYPHVAQVVNADIPLLGQLRPGESVRIELIDLTLARAIDREDRTTRRGEVLRIASLARDRMG